MEASTANVSMIHHVPELIVSDEVYFKFFRHTELSKNHRYALKIAVFLNKM